MFIVLLFLFVSCTSKSGENLIKAVKNNDFEKVKKIVTAENVSFIDENGATPIMWAAFNGNVEILDFLIKNGADATKKGKFSAKRKDVVGSAVFYSYPLNAAAGEGHLEAVKYLIEKAWVLPNENKSALIEAVIAHKKDVVEYLLSKGADHDCNEYDPETTPLEVAFLTFDYEIAELLLKNGASADIFKKRADDFRIYPFFAMIPKECLPPKMDKAAYNQSVKEIVPLLLKNGAVLRNFIFPVSKMCECKNQELVEFMISIGFDPEWQFNNSTIGDYCRNQGIEISEEIIKNSSALEKTRKNEELKQKILLQIIRHQTEEDKDSYYYYYDEDDYPCSTIRGQTEFFLFHETKKVCGKKSSFIADLIESKCISAVGKEMFEQFSAENREPIIIRGAEYFSCKNTGFASDTACLEQIDGQAVYREENCPQPSLKRPRVTFSAPYWDQATNQVFVYKHWYCGSLCSSSSLLVYELKSDGTLEYKYGIGLFRS